MLQLLTATPHYLRLFMHFTILLKRVHGHMLQSTFLFLFTCDGSIFCILYLGDSYKKSLLSTSMYPGIPYTAQMRSMAFIIQ